MTSDDVITFWFEQVDAKLWWQGSKQLDREITERFGNLHAAASRCELYRWRRNAAGRLAEIIILDQFSRNMFRGLPESFAHDQLALCLAQEAVLAGVDRDLPHQQRLFCYMPFLHSESRTVHEMALRLFRDLGPDSNVRLELKQKQIIDRFGRYPHRNDILGRQSTAEEIDYLKQSGAD